MPKDDPEAMRDAFSTIGSAPKQQLAFMTLLQLSGFNRRGQELSEVKKSDLLEKSGVTAPVISALVLVYQSFPVLRPKPLTGSINL